MSANNTWEYKTVTLTMDTVDADWDLNNNFHSLKMSIASSSGSTYETSTANSWVAGEFHTLNTANHNITNAANTVRVTGVSMVLGSTALASTGFITRGTNIAEEVEMCERYFQKSYDLNVEVNTLTNNGIVAIFVTTLTTTIHTVDYSTRMRISTGSVSAYNPGVQLINTARGLTGGANISCTLFSSGEHAATFVLNAASSATDYYGFHWIADSDMYSF